MKKIYITLLALIFILSSAFFTVSCKKAVNEYSADSIAYVGTKEEKIAYLNGIGDFYKTNDGNAMAGFRVSPDNKSVGLVVVGKTETSVTFNYKYKTTVYEYSNGTINYNGENYYYAGGLSYEVDSPITDYKQEIYCAYADSCESFAKLLLEIGDLTKIELPSVSDSAELLRLSNSSKTFVLKNDIDLAGVNFEPIKNFTGSLDGQGFSIKNLTISGTNGNFGLFDELDGATISNLIIDDVSLNIIGNNGKVGALAGVVKNSTVKNVTVKGTVSAILTTHTGGIIGHAENSTIENCKNYATVTGYCRVGGIAGQYACEVKSEDGIIENNENYGAISGLCSTDEGFVGGVFGRVYLVPGAYKKNSENWLKTIVNCNNYGKITGNAEMTGGIIGGSKSPRYSTGDTYVDIGFTNCTNNGEIFGSAQYTGGIAGYLDYSRSIMNCINDGNVVGSAKTGGILGCGSPSTFTMCENDRDVTGTALVGGIVGYTSSIITACTNEGNITANGRINCSVINEEITAGVGGIAGVTTRYVSKSTNNGSVYSTGGGYCIGGIAGAMVASNGDVIEGNVNTDYMNVTGVSYYIGGIVGKLYSRRPGSTIKEGEFTFSGKNTANVTAGESWYVGGIIGYVDTQRDWAYSDRTFVVIINSENTGMITGGTRVAGILGYTLFTRTADIYWSTNKNTGKIVCETEEKADLYYNG